MNENELLRLKGNFERRPGGPAGPPTLPKEESVSSTHLRKLAVNLADVCAFWDEQKLGIDPLVSVYYDRVVAKSNRIHHLFSNRMVSANDSVVGARFYGDPENPKHVITHYVSNDLIQKAIHDLNICAQVIDEKYDSKITSEGLETIIKPKSKPDLNGMPKSTFGQIVRDAFFVYRFGISEIDEDVEGSAIVSFFSTRRTTQELLDHFHINVLSSQILDDAVLLSEEQYRVLKREAPFLIAMATEDLMSHNPGIYRNGTVPLPSAIPSPNSEPIIGVIDTALFENAYFAEWIDFRNEIGSLGEITEDDCKHGTAVSSIIVDGPSLNPDLDDECGRFRVRHFAVAKAGRFSSFQVARKIQQIVESNLDIKVWNLSLGSEFAVRANSISPEAAILDQLQSKYDVVFVVAGTNKANESSDPKIGAPADSINSLVVNSVGRDGLPADYSRRGPVLSFFAKPDIAYYGGTSDRPIMVAGAYAAYGDQGTSFAAPWITRKIAYLIYNMDLPREIAKALLIDSATSWGKIENSSVKGFGVVPIRISDILYAPRDEIRFVISETISSHETAAYNLAVPIADGRFPFIAKATLCYFPSCTRAQGVDYTDTEISFRFGRIEETLKPNKNDELERKITIKTINNDSQDVEGVYVNEKTAREHYRKWDNVKHVGEVLKARSGARKAYGTDRWGIAFRTKERLGTGNRQALRVGLVVTLKELNGKNRIEEFIHNCSVRGWVVTRIDMKQQIDLINAAEVEIEFED